jgi:hypothetical protein
MKKIISILTVISFFIYTAPMTFAGTFYDVPTDAWYFDYVEQLVDDGVVDTGDYYRPADPLNRAELVKIVITAIDGLADYKAPVIPTFDDVADDAWYYDYVESAVQLRIIEGYKDKNGLLTGLFGPNDNINRAAATKILVNGFSIPKDIDPPSVFPDVTESDWFYDFVVTAYNEKILDGYDNGYFGPADPVTRAQIAKMITITMNPPIIIYEDETQPEEPIEPAPSEAEPSEGEEPDAIPNNATLETGNLTGGANEQFVASYNFRGLYEGFYIQTLTVVNDIIGDNFGDDPSPSPAIKNVIIKYPDDNGKLKIHKNPLTADGKAKFSDLTFFAPRDEHAFLEIYVDINPSSIGESLSGEVIRIGLQNVNNDPTTFKAIGAVSSESNTLSSGSLLSDSQSPKYFVIRKSIPMFSVLNNDSGLFNGENNLIGFQISAGEAGSVSFGRIVFNVYVSDNAGNNLTLNDFRLLRGSTFLGDKVNIYDATGGADITGTGGGSVMNGLSNIIVSFNEEEIISAGDIRTYYLKAGAQNVEPDDSISTTIGRDDESVSLTGLSADTNENTGRIYKNGNASDGIFVNADDFSKALGNNRNIIWSDRSADLHLYPTVAIGTVTDGSGSYDFTNGYLLNVVNLPTVTISN